MRKTVNGTTNMYYVLTDHLGSIDAVVPAVSGVMPAVEYYSFDASFHSFESHAKLLPFDPAILRYTLPYFYY